MHCTTLFASQGFPAKSSFPNKKRTSFTPRCHNHSPLRMQSWVHAEDRNPTQNPRFKCWPNFLIPHATLESSVNKKGRLELQRPQIHCISDSIHQEWMALEERSPELVASRKKVLFNMSPNLGAIVLGTQNDSYDPTIHLSKGIHSTQGCWRTNCFTYKIY